MDMKLKKAKEKPWIGIHKSAKPSNNSNQLTTKVKKRPIPAQAQKKKEATPLEKLDMGKITKSSMQESEERVKSKVQVDVSIIYFILSWLAS